MTPLALKIYRHLRKRVSAREPAVTYRDLAAAISSELHPRDPRFHAALGEVTTACRQANLPCLPALVCRADSRRPASGYYKVAHPRARTDETRRLAWERERDRVVAVEFPARLADDG